MGAVLRNYAMPLGIVMVVLMMLVPVPPPVLDAMLATSITLAVVVLLQVLAIPTPAAFTGFPSLLLVATMLRLALNIASTRLILTEAYAGRIIETFGEFTIGGSVVVGLVVLTIITLVNLIVVTQGSTRTTEVNARFKLEAMPGKQLAIDAELNGGNITREEATRRRDEVAREADFFGSMDGAAKFVKGDAIAGILITFVNLIAGLAIGILQRGMDATAAVETYSLLSIGDGLVSQLPALLLSVATGVLVTKSSATAGLTEELSAQLVAQRTPLRVAGLLVAGFAVLPGLPTMTFLVLSTVLFALSFRPDAGGAGHPEDRAGTDDHGVVEVDRDSPEFLAANMRPDPLELVLSSDLADLLGPQHDLRGRTRNVRVEIADDLGLIVPPIEVRIEDAQVGQVGQYSLRVHGTTVAAGEVRVGKLMAFPLGGPETLSAVSTDWVPEPAFGLAAAWIDEQDRTEAVAAGATVVDPAAVVMTHLAEGLRKHASELLSLQQLELLLEALEEEEPQIVALVADENDRLLLHRVLRLLLEERVSIRNLAALVYAVSVESRTTREPEELADAARVAVGGQIVHAVCSPGAELSVVAPDPAAEQELAGLVRTVGGTKMLVFDPQRAQRFVTDLAQRFEQLSSTPDDRPVVIATGRQLRRPLLQLLETYFGSAHGLPVLAYEEVPSYVTVAEISTVQLPVEVAR